MIDTTKYKIATEADFDQLGTSTKIDNSVIEPNSIEEPKNIGTSEIDKTKYETATPKTFGTEKEPSLMEDYADILSGIEPSQLKTGSEAFKAKLQGMKPEEATIGGAFKETGQTFLEAGKNIPASSWRFAKDIAGAVTSPIQTAKSLGGLALGLTQKLIPGEQESEKYVDALTDFYKERYGGLDNIKETFVNDPVGFLSDISLFLTGAGATVKGLSTVSKLDKLQKLKNVSTVGAKVGEVGTAISKTGAVLEPTTAITKTLGTASDVLKPITKPITGKVADIGESIIAKATGLEKDTLRQAVSNVDEFDKAQKGLLTRESLATGVKDLLDQRVKDVSSLGKEYETIRAIEQKVKNPIENINKFVEGKGLSIKDGKLTEKTKLATNLTETDLSQINKAYELVSQADDLTPNEILNLRQKFDSLADFDSGVSSRGKDVIKEIRGKIDEVAKDEVPGLKELDNKFSKEITELNQLKKDLLTKDGKLKDSAVSQITNITGKGKEFKLERLKKLSPNIEKQAKAIKAIEDIAVSTGNKVGTYPRAILAGLSVYQGNLPVAIGLIVTDPNIAVPIAKTIGKIKQGKTITKPEANQLLKALNEVKPQNALRLIEELEE